MKIHKIFLLSLLFPGLANAAATTVAVNPVSSETISVTTLDRSNNYQLNVSWNFKPLKVTGNLFKPSSFVVRCGTNIIVSEGRKLSPSDFNKNISVTAQIKFDAITCPDLVFVAETAISGASTEYVQLSYETFNLGERLEAYTDKKIADRAVNKIAITKYVSKLATYAGSKEALYCVIAGNIDDDLTSGVAESVKTQYQNIYGPYVPGQFSCPVAAEGQLTPSIEYCVANPGEIEPFCLVYDKYKSLSAWYDATIAEVEVKKAGVADVTSEIYQKIDALETALKKDKELFTVIVK